MAKIYQIGEFRLEHKTDFVSIRVAGQPLECEHLNLLLDEHGQVVTCKDCGREIGVWWALVNMARRFAFYLNGSDGARPEPAAAPAPESQPGRPSLLAGRKSSTPESGPQSPPAPQA